MKERPKIVNFEKFKARGSTFNPLLTLLQCKENNETSIEQLREIEKIQDRSLTLDT